MEVKDDLKNTKDNKLERNKYIIETLLLALGVAKFVEMMFESVVTIIELLF